MVSDQKMAIPSTFTTNIFRMQFSYVLKLAQLNWFSFTCRPFLSFWWWDFENLGQLEKLQNFLGKMLFYGQRPENCFYWLIFAKNTFKYTLSVPLKIHWIHFHLIQLWEIVCYQLSYFALCSTALPKGSMHFTQTKIPFTKINKFYKRLCSAHLQPLTTL